MPTINQFGLTSTAAIVISLHFYDTHTLFHHRRSLLILICQYSGFIPRAVGHSSTALSWWQRVLVLDPGTSTQRPQRWCVETNVTCTYNVTEFEFTPYQVHLTFHPSGTTYR